MCGKNGAIRVLHIVSHLTTGSGIMAVILNYYRYIDRQKFQFDFLYFEQADDAHMREIQQLGGNIYKIDRPKLSGAYYRSINNFFKEHGKQYTIIHNHECFLTILFISFVRKYSNAKFIIHSHATQYSDRRWASIRNMLLTVPSFYVANAFFGCSNAAWHFTYDRCWNRCKDTESYIMRNAIDIEHFSFNLLVRKQLRLAYNIKNDNFVIGNVGGFRNQKNHVFLITVFCEVVKQDPNAILMLLGEGRLMSFIKNMVREKGIASNVLFLGKQNNTNEYYQAMDVFVLPSLFEGLPMVAVEAEAAGLPVIMSDTITKEINVVGSTYLSLADSINTWAEKILRFKNSERIESYEKLSQAGFNIKCEVKKLEIEYEKIVGDIS